MKNPFMKKWSLIFAVFSCLLYSCSLDFFGFFGTPVDVDGRYQEEQSLPAVTAFTSTNLPFSFVVIADSHIYGIQNANFVKLQTKLTITDQVVFIDGDLTQNGNVNDFILCRQGLASLGLPYYTVMGNHDLLFGGWKNYKTVFGRSSYTFGAGPVRFIILDNAGGTIGYYQKGWLEGILANRTEPYCVVIAHINIYNFRGGGGDQLTSDEEIAYLMHLFESSAVNYYICGHTHTQNDSALNGVRYLSIGDFRDSPTYLRVTVTATGMSYQFH